jgi:inorganic pyrophosphatase
MRDGVMPNFYDLPIGDGFPATVNAMIEIPRGERTKYEYDPQLRVFKLDRVLHAAVHYPAAYGFIPCTRWDDGDPLDILVVMQDALFTGCLVQAKPIALLQMQDEHGADDKVFSVAVADPVYQDVASLQDISPHIPREIEHFFTTYKMLEGKPVRGVGWADGAAARRAIVQAHQAYSGQH